MSAPYSAVFDGLLAVLAAVPGLTGAHGEEPQSIESPAIYLRAEAGDGADRGQMTIDTHRLVARLAIRWTESSVAELAVRDFLTSVPAAIRAAPNAGGATIVEYTGYTTGFWTVSKVIYRTVDFRITATCK